MSSLTSTEIKCVIPINPVSKKNSQQIYMNPRTGKRFITPSQVYKKYRFDAGAYIMQERPESPIDTKVNVKCLFYMHTRRKVDLVNLQEAVLDVLVDAGMLADDNSRIVVSMDGSRVLWDRENPRTEITITEVEE